MASDCIVALFGGPIELWRLAGLPDPGKEARTYMENQEAHEAEGTNWVPHSRGILPSYAIPVVTLAKRLHFLTHAAASHGPLRGDLKL